MILRFLGALVAVACITAVMMSLDASIARLAGQLPELARELFYHGRDLGKSGPILVTSLVAAIGLVAIARFDNVHGAELKWLAGAFAFVFLAVALNGILVNVFKLLLGRPRPTFDVVAGWSDWQPFILNWRFHSLPSGHSNTVFAFATAVSLLVPRLRLLLFGFACCGAFARVVVERHYFSDIVAGALLAVMGTLLLRWIFASRGWVFDPNGGFSEPGRCLRSQIAEVFFEPALPSGEKSS